MWRWRKVRRANIPEQLRTQFERYGEDVLAHALAVGAHHTQGPELLNIMSGDRSPIMAWLTERRDIHERREDRLETVEWAILIFVIVGVLADVAIVAHESGIWP
jgi:hypothetical protein